jgi:hypothetical protein
VKISAPASRGQPALSGIDDRGMRPFLLLATTSAALRHQQMQRVDATHKTEEPHRRRVEPLRVALRDQHEESRCLVEGDVA